MVHFPELNFSKYNGLDSFRCHSERCSCSTVHVYLYYRHTPYTFLYKIETQQQQQQQQQRQSDNPPIQLTMNRMDPREKEAKEAKRKRNKELLSKAFKEVVGSQLEKAKRQQSSHSTGLCLHSFSLMCLVTIIFSYT